MRGHRVWARRLGVHCGAGILGVSGRLTRVRMIHAERDAAAVDRFGSVVYALWHGRMWLLASRFPRRGVGVLVSLSEDGDLIARVLEKLDLVPIRGSSSRGGGEGLRELETHLREGVTVAITPDGPRGPRHQARMGAVALAARTGKPIIPIGAAASRFWTLRSWDAFQIPKPGASGVIVIGAPILVPAAEDLEPWRRQLEEALIAVEAEADLAVRS